jgi:uncharacterized membrane protein
LDGGFRGGVIDFAGSSGDHSLLWVIFAVLLIVLVVTLVNLFLDEYRRTQDARADGHEPPLETDAHEAPTQVVDVQPESPPVDVHAEPDESASPAGNPLAILDARYAAGEVARKDYLRIRRDILGPNAATS